MTKRADFEEHLQFIRHSCEGALYDGQDCNGPFAANEVLYTKGQFPRNQKFHDYLDNEINCAWMCQKHHADVGHTTVFRHWFFSLQCQRYSREAVRKYLLEAPVKIKNNYVEET
jgi:hypothetical protein